MLVTRIIVIVGFFILSACNSGENSSNPIGTTTDSTEFTVIIPTKDSAIDDGHYASNSLDWAGNYTGVLPCDDCSGIDTRIELNKAETYKLTTKIEGKTKIESESQEGSFIWVDGSTIKLLDRENKPAFYFVAENRLVQLDLSGKQIKGPLSEKYILVKQ